MSPAAITYLVGLALVYVGERLLAGHDGWRAAATGLGVLALAAAGGWVLRRMRSASDPGQRLAHRTMLAGLLATAASLVLYAGTTRGVTDAMGLADEALARWRGAVGALWPIATLVGSTVFLVLDRVSVKDPVLLPVARVRHVLAAALAASLGVALVFPVDYIAARKNHRWDLTHFKTTEVGSATRNLAAALDEPLNVRIFLPPASEVADELLGYFRQIEGPNLTVEVMDAAAHPRLARALQIRDNGVVAITRGEVDAGADALDPKAPRPVTRTIQVGKDLDQAKRTLKKLDSEVHKILMELGQGERVAYFTAGHGELGWTGTRPPDRSLRAFKQLLKALHFKVETLSLTSGLADAVPEDADLVVVAGPVEPFLPAEVEALRRYLEGGGALLVALEPASLGARAPLGKHGGLAALAGGEAPLGAKAGADGKGGDDGKGGAKAGADAKDEAKAGTEAKGEAKAGTDAKGEAKAGADAKGAAKAGADGAPDAPEGAAPAAEGPDPLQEWLATLGVRMGKGVLAAEGGIVPLWHAKRDRLNLVTDRFSIHPSTTTLAEHAGRLLLFTPGSGFWERADAPGRKVIFTARSLALSWADLDGDLELDAGAGEAKRERPIVAAIEPEVEGQSWRVLAVADATALSDLAIGNLGNQQFLFDGVNWLVGAEALSGTTESEEDVKIEHTKEDQALWFYATVLGVPVLVLALGAIRIRRRRRGGRS